MPERDIWKELRKPFAKESVGMLPKPYKKDSPKGKCSECGGYHGLPAVHLDYVGHAAVTDRLNDVVGPDKWNWRPMAVDEWGLPKLDSDRNLWIWLKIDDVEKPGVGDGNNMKERIGDALRNAAMRFGIALDLWSKEELESTLDDPSMKNDKPSAKIAPTAPISTEEKVMSVMTDVTPPTPKQVFTIRNMSRKLGADKEATEKLIGQIQTEKQAETTIDKLTKRLDRKEQDARD